jgi:hypothetical protein
LSALPPAIRRQILKDLGIEVWLPRAPAPPGTALPAPGAGSPARGAGSPTDAATARAGKPASGEARLNVEAPAAAERSRAGAPPEPRTASSPAVDSAITAPAAAVAPLAVLSIATSGAVLLIEGSPARRDLRLAMDVLAAISADLQSKSAGRRAKPVTRRFAWPPPVAADVLTSAPDARRRALEAFVDKDLGDHGGRVLLVSERLAAELPDRWPDCERVMVPDLDLLGREAPLKRALWRDIQQTLQRLDRRANRPVA